VAETLWSRLRPASLGAKLILFSALLTALTVSAALLCLHLELRKQTRDLLAGTLAHHQRLLAALQKRDLRELVRISAIMSESPTLRAAMETYRSESISGSRPRADLLATVQNEAEAIASGLARGLLIVTDDRGRVLAATGRPEDRPATGEDLGAWPAVRHALAQDAPVGPLNFSVRVIRDGVFQIGCVPMILQGYVIGTLVLGDRLDQGLAARLRDSLGGDIMVTAGDRVLGSTLPGATLPAAAGGGDPPRSATDGGARVVALGGEEYVVAPVVIGQDQEGRPVSLHLLRSLTGALAGPQHALRYTLAGYGLLVVMLAGLSASVVSRSVLRPLADLVAFMRAAAANPGRSRRFEVEGSGAEIRVLGQTFNRLMEALERHEEQLLTSTREDLLRLERLKESEKLAALGRMLSGAAHEINNPLTGMLGNVEILLEEGSLEEHVRQRLERVRAEGRRIVALARNLLRVARRDGGRRATTDLGQVIRDSVALRRHDFDRARIAVTLDLPSRPIPIVAGELELQQVFLNLLNNAYDALHEAPGRPALTLRVYETPAEVTITVRDNGPGMEDPARVFEHFYTTKPVGQGTGLGLSISQAIVADHGGRMTAENAPEGGARFTIVLPRGAAPAEPVAAPRPAPRHLPASVLVVDDEPTVLELQMAILDGLGARAIAARTGEEAIDLLKTRDFDLIVSDLVLPGTITGQELHDWIRAHRRAGTRGFLLVTGEPADQSPFLKRAAARCLPKPFTMEEYVHALREAWDEMQSAA
jgi:signal transduction histidine kinase/ActR/RegA family two-component response regulator